MANFSDILVAATQAVGEEYFQLAIAGGDPVYRERVYCYELYHQMRLAWLDKKAMPFVLSGEVDKKGHPIISALDMGLPIPDFLVHQPGDMGKNHAVMEVKSQNATPEGIRKDFTTLSDFRTKAGHTRAIFILYGMTISRRQIDWVIEHGKKTGNDIEFWIHPGPGRPAELVMVFNTLIG